MSRRSINAPGAAAIGPYSHAAGNNELMFLSGQTPMDASTKKLVSGSIADQTRQCFSNLFTVLAAAGLTEKDVLNVQVYLTDMNDFAEMNDVYAEQFSEAYPARTTIGVASLPMNADIEIGMVANARP